MSRASRRAVVAAAREMKARGFVNGTTGNVSVRTSRGMLITPSRTPYETLRPRSLVHVALDGRTLGRHGGEPSLEWPIHAAIYGEQSDARAIVHTHSPWATARGFKPEPLEARTEERSYYELESVPVVAPHPPGSESLAKAVTARIRHSGALLLARHGVIAVGQSPSEALERCALVEYLAQVDLITTATPELLAAMPVPPR